ncbi:DUF3367 domain-containing protein [Actinomadura craniellae]|uniref:DUF3367 domain-containing protein n=1 Tax=Actinomadura craniellae TaxID=2231787 RepID=A0A365GZD7_9ACTN|nr:alpha-(1->3)-arabinofuranosyltransferase family protein [Actinomadura craniellae]RAY12199.1 DUF3367 domain-containing protein [Actinomadura craniellae]
MTAIRTRADALAARLARADDPEPRDDIDVRLRQRFRTALCCLALVVLVTSTRPGRVLADTKIDMAVNPLGFLGRALHLWDVQHFGQLQNQAAGYFFPMGPFYSAGNLLGLPEWITQRLWLSTLLCLAFLGTVRLAERLGIGGPATRLFGGMAYALGPHGLSALGQNSWEYLPLAMLPWIVLPLVTAAGGGGLIRAAARSGVAVALCGGINATATVAVLVVPFLYIVTRPRPLPRLRLLCYWSAAVGCAVAWWLVPLLLTGRFGFSWLGYTEQAEVTAKTTGLIDVLRGAARWINYLDATSLPVGHALSLQGWLILATAALAALGVAGLVSRGLPDRTFLVLTAVTGLAIIATGHTSVIEGPLAAPARDLLDGPLAPLRNLHKFDGLVRLPLALGLIHLLATARAPRPRLRLVAVTTAALAAITTPALGNGLAGPGDFPAVPQHWRDAANWLNGRAGEQAVLALPGARFGEYTWGRPMDDIMQPLLRTRWGARLLVPQGSPGYARIVDAIDQRVAAGRGSSGLTQVLSRMGVRYLLVRNDLSRNDLRGAWPARVHEALDTSPGIRRVATFGELTGGVWADEAVGAYDQQYPALEIYEVDDADDVVGLLDTAGAIRLRGAPEALLGLADNGLLRGRPVLFGDDDPAAGGEPVTSDALRLRQRNLGEIRSGISPTLTIDAPPSQAAGLGADPTEPGWERDRTVAVYAGVRGVTASSSAADPDALPGLDDPGAAPYAALDGDPHSQWTSGGWNGAVGQWLRVDFTAPLEPRQITAAFVRNDFLGPAPARVAVETAAGTVEQDLRPATGPQQLLAPAGRTGWLRIRVVKLARTPDTLFTSRVAISELKIPGVTATRYLRPPVPVVQVAAPQSAAPTGAGSYMLNRAGPVRPDCMRGPVRWVCSPELARGEEEGAMFNRLLLSAAPGQILLSGTAVLTDPAVIERFARRDSSIRVSASSAWVRHPAGQARSAFDGSPATTWVAGGDDTRPTLTIGWGRARTVDAVTVQRPPGARAPLQVTVRGAGGDVREGLVDDSGVLRFRAMRTDRLVLRFESRQRPLQVSEVVIPGVRPLAATDFQPYTSACGAGPEVTVNGIPVETRVTTTLDETLGGRAVGFAACRPVRLAAGANRLSGGGAYRVESVVLDAGGRLSGAQGRATTPVRVRSWGQGERTVQVEAANRAYLVVNENFNAGWRATIGGRALTPTRLDGWRQAWVVPAGTRGVVTLRYEPDGVYRPAVFTGLALLVTLLVLACALPGGRRTAPRPPGGAPAARRAGLLRRLPGGTSPVLRADAGGEGGGPSPVRRAGTGGGGGGPFRRAPGRASPPRWLVPLPAAAFGYWVAGALGLVVAAEVAVMVCLVFGRVLYPFRVLASPWLPAVALLLGGVSVAAGTWLSLNGGSDGAIDLFRDTVPQLLGLVVAGRLFAQLAAPSGRAPLDEVPRDRVGRYRPRETPALD